MCLVIDTARKIGISESTLIKEAVLAFRDRKTGKPFSDPLTIAEDRYLRWFKFGELPNYIENYLLDQWVIFNEPYPLPIDLKEVV